MGRPKKVVPGNEQPANESPVVSPPEEIKPTVEPVETKVEEIKAEEIGSALISGMPELKPGQTRAIVESQNPDDFKLDPTEPATPPDEKKKRGRPAGSSSKAKQAKGTEAVMSHDPTVPDKYDATAELYVETAIYGAASLVSAEWMPRDQNEARPVKQALARYLRFKQMDDLPPGIAFLGAVLIYAGPRFFMPETKAKVAKLLGKKPEEKPEDKNPEKKDEIK